MERKLSGEGNQGRARGAAEATGPQWGCSPAQGARPWGARSGDARAPWTTACTTDGNLRLPSPHPTCEGVHSLCLSVGRKPPGTQSIVGTPWQTVAAGSSPGGGQGQGRAYWETQNGVGCPARAGPPSAKMEAVFTGDVCYGLQTVPASSTQQSVTGHRTQCHGARKTPAGLSLVPWP